MTTMIDDDTVPFGEEDTFKQSTLTHPYVTFFHLVFRCSAVIVYMFSSVFTNGFIASFVLIILLLSMDFWTVKNITGAEDASKNCTMKVWMNDFIGYLLLTVLLSSEYLIAQICRVPIYYESCAKSLKMKEKNRINGAPKRQIVCVVAAILLSLIDKDFWRPFKSIYVLSSKCFGRIMVGLRWWNYVDEEGISHWVFESRKGNARVNPTESRIFWSSLIGVTVMWVFLFIVGLLSFKFKWLLLVCIALCLNFANLYGYLRCRSGPSDQPLSSSVSSFTSNIFRKHLIQSMVSSMSAKPASGPTSPMQQPPTNIV